MFALLFESDEQRDADNAEIGRLRAKYGDELLAVLRQRARLPRISTRDRRHWQRILKKAQRET